MRRAMMELPAEQREEVELAFFEGLKHKEIAEKTSVALGTIKTRIRLGLLKIKDRLRGVMGESVVAEAEELERQERV